ncbi:MAG: hypothetical protein R6X16_07945 [Anaerolineae bacterium]
MTDRRKRIVVVGAGWDQTPIIQEAKAQGYYVVALDGDAEAYGLQFADKALSVSTRDMEGVLAVARSERADALTYMITESPLRSVRYAADALGLPAPSHLAVEATVSKPRMREIFAAAGIRNPGYAKASSLPVALDRARDLGFPLVLKSADVGGQLGLHVLHSLEDLERSFDDAQASSYGGEVILEQLLMGPEVNVVAIVLDGQIQEMTISDRIKDEHKGFGVVMRHLYPADCTATVADQITDVCQRSVRAMELKDGIIFPQLIVSDEGPVIVETGVRIPGGVMKELFEYATGYNLVKVQLDISLGCFGELSQYRLAEPHEAVTVKFINGDPGPLRPGKVSGVLGRDDALSVAGVVEAQYYNDPTRPQEVRPLVNGRDRFYYVIAVGTSREQVVESSDRATSLLDIVSETGESLKIRAY